MVFSKTIYAQQHLFNGMWVEIYSDSTDEKLQKRCRKFDEGIYKGIFFVNDSLTEYLIANKIYWGNIKKIQRLKSTSFEIVDLSYGSGRVTDEPTYHTTARELWTISTDKKTLIKVNLNDKTANISKWQLCS
tara:strand:+ start:495 stop:890 length:396 start_codon:yes stop_codon:yes gene_type:complete